MISETNPDSGKTQLYVRLSDGTYCEWASENVVKDEGLVDRLSDGYAEWERTTYPIGNGI